MTQLSARQKVAQQDTTAKTPPSAGPEGIAIAPPQNRTGLPDELKADVENLSGLSLDDVRVHYNSSKPAELQALAYTQGTDIHVAPGQEHHLPHEAWHVVQQAQARVKPTMRMKDIIPVNDAQRLEHEADEMGARAMQASPEKTAVVSPGQRASYSIAPPVTQLKMGWQLVSKTLSDLLATHKLQKKYQQMWSDGDVRRISEEIGGMEDTDKDNVKRRLVLHKDITPLLRPYRMVLEPSKIHEKPPDTQTVDPDELNDVYQSFLSLLCYHASQKAEDVRETGLDPAKGGSAGGYSDERSLSGKREENLKAAKGKVFVTRKYTEAKQYAEGVEDRIVMLIVPREIQDNIDQLGTRFEVDPDSMLGTMGTDYLKGTISKDGVPNYWATLYLLKEMKDEEAKLNFHKLWEVLRTQGRIKP